MFVLTHEKRDVEVRGKTTFTFVEGIENAVEQATAAAGGKDVAVSGGASVIRQCLAAGLLDEIQLHVVPLLLGAGVRLFDGVRADFEITRVIESPRVTHVRYRVRR